MYAICSPDVYLRRLSAVDSRLSNDQSMLYGVLTRSVSVWLRSCNSR